MKNKDLPSIKEFRRILSIADDNPALAATLRSLRNAWLLCDTEYVNTHSDFEQAEKEMREMEQKYTELQKKHRQLGYKIKEMDDISRTVTAEPKKANFNDLIHKITKTYSNDYNVIFDDIGFDVESDEEDDSDI